ncbi:hypothetical protein ABZY20_29155 [Streptomyces sp. NPDC006624]
MPHEVGAVVAVERGAPVEVLTIEVDTLVHAGHGPDTAIAAERRNVPAP